MNSNNYNSIFKDYYYFNREEEENENENSNYHLRKFKNPHLIYFEEIEGNSNDNDAAISNRFILKKKLSNEIYSEIKKNPGGGPFTLYRLYSNKNKNGKRNNTLSWSLGNSSRNDSGIDNSYKGKRNAKASGFGY